jgi:protein O-GlcNAc transferase
MQMGQSQEAMETYQMALTLNPALVDAHSNLGNLYKAQGDLEGAKRCYLEAVRINPEFSIAWSNLAGVFKDEGQQQTAEAYYVEAIRLCPEFADAHSNLGNTYKDMGMLEKATACYETAIKLRPDFAIAHGNLGVCQWESGRLDLAVKSLKYAIQLEPNYPDAFNNLGNVQRQENNLEQAVQSFRNALRLKPDHPHAYNNLGNAMTDLGMVKEAIHCYVTAIRLLPSYAAAHSNLGSVLRDQGKLDQAIAHYLEAINRDEFFADAFSNLGNCYKLKGRPSEAAQCYQRALQIDPKHADAYTNLAAVHKDTGDVVKAYEYYQQALALSPGHNEAFANLFHTKMHMCDWDNYESDFAKLMQITEAQLARRQQGLVPSVQPFHALSYPMSMAEMLRLAQRYSAQAKEAVGLVETHFTFRPKPKSIRLRIGYVSSDFGNHPMMHLMQSVFGMHDSNRFEVFCYATSGPDGSALRRKIEATTEHFKDISQLHAGEAAQLIHNDGVHILINLNGFTRGARNEIFALHPSPLQMSFLGYAGTMGADYIEYMIADPTTVRMLFYFPPSFLVVCDVSLSLSRSITACLYSLTPFDTSLTVIPIPQPSIDTIPTLLITLQVPVESRQYYSEKIVSLPHTYLVNDHKQSSRDAMTHEPMGDNPAHKAISRARYGISEDKFVFCNFNQMYKIDPATFDTWMNILKRVPNGVLWLLRFPPAAEERIRQEALNRGVKEDQIIFSDVAVREEHLLRGHLADLFLDTPCYNAHSTASDILWSGTPMLTIQQEKMASRVASSLLQSVGLEQLVYKDHLQYEEAAVSLAGDSEKLFGMRRHIERVRDTSAAFDTERWVRNLEKGLMGAWSNLESGNPFEDVTVEDAEPAWIEADLSLI